jgi:hypothetical protein
MSVVDTNQVKEVWERVKTWPPAPRITLARRILESLETPDIPAVRPRRSLKDLLGLLKTDAPPPTDEDCRRILEEELMEKHLR